MPQAIDFANNLRPFQSNNFSTHQVNVPAHHAALSQGNDPTSRLDGSANRAIHLQSSPNQDHIAINSSPLFHLGKTTQDA